MSGVPAHPTTVTRCGGTEKPVSWYGTFGLCPPRDQHERLRAAKVLLRDYPVARLRQAAEQWQNEARRGLAVAERTARSARVGAQLAAELRSLLSSRGDEETPTLASWLSQFRGVDCPHYAEVLGRLFRLPEANAPDFYQALHAWEEAVQHLRYREGDPAACEV